MSNAADAVNEAIVRVDNAIESAQAAANQFTGMTDAFATALTVAAAGIGASTARISAFISTPTAPALTPPSLPPTFQPTTLDFGMEPLFGTHAVPTEPASPIAPLDTIGSAPTPPTDFTGVAPVPTYVLNPPVAPTAPTPVMPNEPTFLPINMPVFSDVAPSYVPDYTNFNLITPDITPYIEPDTGIVASLQAHRGLLISRITNGGTILPPAVEQGIWDRARDREWNDALNAERDAIRQDAANGFALPSGALQAKLMKVRTDFAGKIITVSRDIAIKQAEMEVDNINKAYEQMTQLEGQLVQADIAMKANALAAARYATESAVQIFDAQVKGYMASLDARKISVQIYQAMMEAFTARVNAYKAQIDGEKAKSEYNRDLVAMYESEIRAEIAKLDIFKTQVMAMDASVRVEEFKIRQFESQIGAFTAQVNAYTAQVSGKNAEAQNYGERVRAFQSRVGAYAAEVGAYTSKYTANVEVYKSLIQADLAKTDMYKARVEAQGIKSQAELGYASVLQHSASTYAGAMASYNEVLVKEWEAATQSHFTAQTILANTTKMNTDTMQTARAMSLDAAKAGAQVYAQLTGSALNMVHYSVGAGGNAGLSDSYAEQHNYQEK